MNNKLSLYPPCMPYDTGYHLAGEHNIYYEQCGNPDGKPALFLHGGPGGGGDVNVRRFLIQRFIVLLFLIKEVAAEVNPMAY